MEKDLEAGSQPSAAPHRLRAPHTPGTWFVSRDQCAVATTAPIGGNIICEAPEGFRDSMENWTGNARLIAASLDFYEAAKALLASEELGTSGNDVEAMLEHGRGWSLMLAAIAKAEGLDAVAEQGLPKAANPSSPRAQE
jgi:hypothetical protein